METVNQNDYDREMYRIKCKHLSMEEMCYAHSGWSTNGMMHITMSCDCNCRRMKNYDKKHNNQSSASE